MSLTWWQRRTSGQIAWATMAVTATYGVLLPVLARTHHRLLLALAVATSSSVIGLVLGAGGVGSRSQALLLRQAYRELRIPPGVDRPRWRNHFLARIAQHDAAWSRITGVWTGIVASLAVPAALTLPLWWCGVGLAAVAIVDVIMTRRSGDREPRWLDDTRFLLIQLDAQDGVRDP